MTDAKVRRTVWICTAVILLIIVLDQVLKIWVKTSFAPGESVQILPFFKLSFVQNNGMAFGWTFAGSKLLLTLFRLFATVFGFWYLRKLLHKKEVSTGACISVSLVLAGAIGNLIDCIIYGVVFHEAPLLFGQVVDMISFTFFPFIFNVADAAVTVGVALIVLFYSGKLSIKNEKEQHS